MAPTETFEFIDPMKFATRDGGRSTKTKVRTITLHRHEEGGGEPNLGLAQSLARSVRHQDGRPATVDELIGFQVERGIREMLAPIFTRMGIL